MSTQQQPAGYPPPPPGATPATPPKKKRRIFLWIFLAIQVLFVIWIITAASSGNDTPTHCGSLSANTCNDAQNVGTGIGVALVVVLWMVVDFLLGVIYGVYRLAKRT